MMDLERDNIDVAIRFGYGPDHGLYSLPLAEEWVTPVMIPALAERFPTPESLRDAVLIQDESINFLKVPANWQQWFKAMGVPVIEPTGPKFSQADHAVDAAIAGVGVVMGRRALVVKDLAEGRLVAPYGVALPVDARFRFICAKGDEERPQIAAFRKWICEEIDKTKATAESLELYRGTPLQN